MRLDFGESAAKVTTSTPLSMARLIGSMNGSDCIGCSRMPAGLLDQILFERGDLLGDVVVGRAREDRLAAHRLGRLLEALVDRHPVGVGRDHDVHDVGFARLRTGICSGRMRPPSRRGQASSSPRPRARPVQNSSLSPPRCLPPPPQCWQHYRWPARNFILRNFSQRLLMCQRAPTMSSEVHENSISEISCS